MPVRISLTGRVSIEVNGASVDEQRFPGRQGRLLFAYLTAEMGRPVPRDELAEALWGGELPATWEKALTVLVSKLRTLLATSGLDGATITGAFGCYELQLPEDAWVDVIAAEGAVKHAERSLASSDPESARMVATDATELLRREFLPGDDSPWVEERRRHLQQFQLRALECLADACFGSGHPSESARAAEEIVQLEPFQESGYRRLMLAHIASGNSAEALTVYERCRRLLAEELGAYPSSEIESVYREILGGTASAPPADVRMPAVAPPRGSPSTGLPVPATPFLGRSEELTAVVALLRDPTIRLVTLTGAGGTGKTRLAIQAAADVSGTFPDGVYWVPLADLRDPALIPGAVAGAIAVQQQRGRELEELVGERLAGKQALLLLDNAEHLMQEITTTIAWLRDLDGPTVLVTSRERLRLQGEHTWPVPGLNAEDGAQLFDTRARAINPTFRTSEATNELCSRLDHLPLAIELAAARTSVFSVEQLIDRVGQRLDVLQGMRDVDPRQRTLRTTIEWSHELLDPDEKRALAALSVFVGGWTLESGEIVCEANADLLESLIDKSLVRHRETELGGRFRMLETIREYASEQLEASDDALAVCDRHAAWATQLADALWDSRRGDDQAQARVRFEEERSNLRAAGSHSVETGNADRALRIARASATDAHASGGWAREAVADLERALAVPGDVDPVLRIEAFRQLVVVSNGRLGSPDRKTQAALAEDAVALARELGDDEVLAVALNALGNAQEVIDNVVARRAYEEAIRILRPLEATPELTIALHSFGCLLHLEGEHEAADAHFREALDLQLAGVSPWGSWGIPQTQGHVAETAWLLGRHEESYAHAREAAALMGEGDPTGLARSLFIAAAVVAARGEAKRAGVLLGVVDRAYAAAGEQQWDGALMLRAEILARATPEEREELLEGLQAEPTLTLKQALAETFPGFEARAPGIATRTTRHAAPRRPEPRGTGLPVAATPFLGRDEELAAVVALLGNPDARLVTLTGAGGTGKTRLAIQAAADVSGTFPDGVYWVPLAGLRDAHLVPGAVAVAIGLPLHPGRDLEGVLAEHLVNKRALLLLDNAEHLLPEVATTIAWLRDLAGPTVLVTSRERLRLQGEQAWPVPGLNANDGVELFLARTRAIDPSFALSQSVDELCARLDRLPLALELAAARTSVFDVDQLLDRLGQRLDLLKGVRDADPRQRTLRATIEWSHDLLNADEQRVFAALSIFVGGWTLEAAEGICDANADLLESLIDKSLVRHRETELGQRYWMLETIREFASERLEQHNDVRALRDRYMSWAAHIADGLWDSFWDERQTDAFVRFREEHGNLRAAGAHATSAGDDDRALRIARAGGFYARGGWTKGAAAELERALSLAVNADPALRIESLSLLVLVLGKLGDRDRQIAHAQEAVALARDACSDELLGRALEMLGVARHGVDSHAALAAFDEAVRVIRPLGATPLLSSVLHNFAITLVLERDHEAAEALFRETLELERTGVNAYGPMSLSAPHLGLATVAWYLHREDEAYTHARAAAEADLRAGDPVGLAASLRIAAAVTATRGEPHRAGVLLGVVDRVVADEGAQPFPDEALLRDDILAHATAEEREQLLEGMQAEPTLTLEQALAETFPGL